MERQSTRFALRKEYFGGLLLDYEKSDFELLNPTEFHLLESLTNIKENVLLPDVQDEGLRKRINNLSERGSVKIRDKGQIETVNTRIIKPPEKPPADYLTAPLMVYDTTTRGCNLACEHCYASSTPLFIEDRRTLTQTKEIMDKFYEIGALEWRFTGGEPTVTPDFTSAIDYAQSLGMKVSLNTNGIWSERVTKEVLNSGVSTLVVSLEGRQTTHDRRREKGTFNRLINRLRLIYEHNETNPNHKITVVLNMSVGKDNIPDLDYVVGVAAEYGFNINFVPLKPAGRASTSMPDEILSTREYMEFAQEVQRLREAPNISESGIKLGLKHKDLFSPDYKDKSDFPYPFNYSECGALATAISILPDGRAFACPFLMDDEGYIGPNLNQVSVYEAWMDPIMEHFRRATKVDCTDCIFYMQQCRGKCKAIVLLSGGEIKDGKLIGDDPYCFKALIPKYEQN